MKAVSFEPCPSRDDLLALLAEEMSAEQSERLGQHVAACPHCQSVLDESSRDEELIGRCRELKQLRTAEFPNTKTLAERLTGGFDERSTPKPLETLAHMPATPVSSSEPPVADDSDLLRHFSPPEAPDEIARLGPYRILHRLGAGGMGVVFRAVEQPLDRMVALKVLRPSFSLEPTARERLLREARAAASLHCDHVVTVHHVGEANGVLYLAMELLEGESLQKRLSRVGRLPVAEVCRLGREVALGLAEAHERGLVHRDIKPENIWLEPSGRAKILDFGLARPMRLDAGLSQQGLVVGTPRYMAPEQAQAHPVDGRTDLFSLGCVLYRACTGQTAFGGEDLMSVLHSLATATPRPVRSFAPEVPAPLERLIERLLQKDPALRPASAADVAEELVGLVSAEPERRKPRTWFKTGLAAFFAAAVVLASVVIIIEHNGKKTKIEVPDQSVARITIPAQGDIQVETQPLDGLPAAPVKPRAVPKGPVPADSLRRDAIPKGDLQRQGNGDPAKAAAELVAVFGDSRFRIDGPSGAAITAGVPAYSPDGAWLAVPSHLDVVLFDAKSGAFLRRFTGSTGRRISRLQFSHDGRMLAAVADGVVVDLWESTTGKHLRAIQVPGPLVWWLAFHPNGKLLATAGGDGMLRLWETATGNAVGEPRKHPTDLRHVEFSPDGTLLATGCLDGKCYLWQGEEWRKCETLPLTGRADSVHVTFSRDGKQLAIGGHEAIRVLDVATREVIFSEATRAAFIAFTPDGESIVTGKYNPAIAPHDFQRWDLKSKKKLAQWTFDPRGAYVFPVLHPDGKTLAAIRENERLVHILDVDTGSTGVTPVPLPEAGHAGGVMAVAFSPDGRRLASGDNRGVIKIWDVPGGQELATLSGHHGQVIALAFSPQGDILASASSDNSIRLWNVDAARVFQVFTDHRNTVGALAFHPGGAWLASGGDKTVRIWSMTEKKLLKTLADHTDLVTGVDFSPDGQTLVSAGWDHRVILWDFPTGKRIQTLQVPSPNRLNGVVFYPDGQTVAAVGDNGMVHRWQWKSGVPLPDSEPIGGNHYLTRSAIDPAGRWLASVGSDGRLHVWRNPSDDAKPPKLAAFRTEHGRGLAFSPDGRHLAAGTGAGTVYLFRLADPK